MDVVVCVVTVGVEGPVSLRQMMVAVLLNFHEEKWTQQHLYSPHLKHMEIWSSKFMPSKYFQFRKKLR